MWLRLVGFLFQAVFSFLSPIYTITRVVQQAVKPLFRIVKYDKPRCLPGLSVEDSSSTSGSAMSDEAVLRHVLDRIKLMHQEFEELLFLKYATEMLKDFRKRLLQKRWG